MLSWETGQFRATWATPLFQGDATVSSNSEKKQLNMEWCGLVWAENILYLSLSLPLSLSLSLSPIWKSYLTARNSVSAMGQVIASLGRAAMILYIISEINCDEVKVRLGKVPPYISLLHYYHLSLLLQLTSVMFNIPYLLESKLKASRIFRIDKVGLRICMAYNAYIPASCLDMSVTLASWIMRPCHRSDNCLIWYFKLIVLKEFQILCKI